MVNRYRGEISAEFDGIKQTLCLTLGALAELEEAFGEQDLLSLAERFASGRITSSDAMHILGAGLRGAGHTISDEEVGKLKVDGGAAGYISVVARLLTATFGDDKQQSAQGTDKRGAPSKPGK